MRSPGGTANQDNALKLRHSREQKREIFHSFSNVFSPCRSNRCSTAAPDIPRDYVPDSYFVPTDTRYCQLSPRFPCRWIRIFERDSPALNRLGARRFQQEQKLCLFVPVARIKAGALIRSTISENVIGLEGQRRAHRQFCSEAEQLSECSALLALTLSE